METLATQLLELEDAQLVRRAPEEDLAYLFKHALTQEVSYDSLLLRRRREVHRRVAEAYERIYTEELDAFSALLAKHYQEAGEDGKLVVYATRAGDHAARLGAEPEAAGHYALALAALSRLPDTDENRRTQVDTLIKRTAVSFASASVEQNLATLAKAESAIRNLLSTNATDPLDHLRLARIQSWSARMHFFKQERRAALHDFVKVLTVAEELGDLELAAVASSLMGRTSLWEGEFQRAEELLQRALKFLEQGQNWIELILTRSMIGIALAAQGRYKEGINYAERALEQANELHHVNGAAGALSSLAIVHLMGGAILPMLEASKKAVETGLESGNQMSLFIGWAMEACGESRLGQHETARGIMKEAEALAEKFGGHMFLDDWLAAIQVELALNVGHVEEALSRALDALTLAQSVDGKFAEAMIHRSCGQARAVLDSSHWEQAEVDFKTSVDLFDSGNAVLESARTLVAWGQLLQTRGQIEPAREHFERAMTTFQDAGLAQELERVRGLCESLPT